MILVCVDGREQTYARYDGRELLRKLKIVDEPLTPAEVEQFRLHGEKIFEIVPPPKDYAG